MALPVNKQKLDATILTNLPNNQQQLITAATLRNTLTPIVDSTFGLKTIWSGMLKFADASGGVNNNSFFVWEDYYDPNYLPSLSPTTLDRPLAEYQQTGNRYKLVNVGAGMTPGTYTNIPTNLVNNNPTINVPWRPPFGLTFDFIVGSGGTVTAIKVNNPGSGYSWCGNFGANTIVNQRVELNIAATTKAVVEIDLSRVISGYNATGGDEGYPDIPINGTTQRAFICNFHVLNAGPSIGYGTNILINENPATVPIPFVGYDQSGLQFQYDSAYPYKLYQFAGRTLPGYYATIPVITSTNPDVVSYAKWVEVKVPITNAVSPT